MTSISFNTGDKQVVFTLPSNLSEISDAYLKSITKHVYVAKHYSLIAIVYPQSLGQFIMTIKQNKKNLQAGVIPIFIKGNADVDSFINNIQLKDRLIISSSQLALAQHIAIPNNVLGVDYFVNVATKDNNAYKKGIGNRDVAFFVEFKLVPNNDILGYYSGNVDTSKTIDYAIEVTVDKAIDNKSSTN